MLILSFSVCIHVVSSIAYILTFVLFLWWFMGGVLCLLFSLLLFIISGTFIIRVELNYALMKLFYDWQDALGFIPEDLLALIVKRAAHFLTAYLFCFCSCFLSNSFWHWWTALWATFYKKTSLFISLLFHLYIWYMQLPTRILKGLRTRMIQIIQLWVLYLFPAWKSLSSQHIFDLTTFNCRYLLAIWILMSQMTIWDKFSANTDN